MKIKKNLIFTITLILLVIIGVYNIMSTKPEKIPAILLNEEGIKRINKESKELWGKYMINLTEVIMLSDDELKLFPSIALLGNQISLYPASNLPAHIQARISKNRNVRIVFIFEPGTMPQWNKLKSAITIDSNIFIQHSSEQ